MSWFCGLFCSKGMSVGFTSLNSGPRLENFKIHGVINKELLISSRSDQTTISHFSSKLFGTFSIIKRDYCS